MGFPLPSNDPLGTDLLLDENGDLTVSISGSLQTVSQEQNVQQAIRVTIATSPQLYFWDDDVGSLLPSFVDQPITPQLEQDIATIVTEKAMQDPRVIDVISVQVDDSNPDSLIIFMSLTVSGVGDVQFPIVVSQTGGA